MGAVAILGGLVFFALALCLAFMAYKFFKGEELKIPFLDIVVLEADPEKKIAVSGLLCEGKGKGHPPGAPTTIPKVPASGPCAPPKGVGKGQPIGKSRHTVGTAELMSLPVCQDVEFADHEGQDFPDYWTKKGRKSLTVHRHQVTEASLASVQALMDGTWRDIKTRDRKEDGGIQKFQVVQVLRIENLGLWQKYSEYRDRIEEACKNNSEFVQHHVQTHDLAPEDEDVARILEKMKLRPDANEFLLFHGTKPTSAAAICENGFHVDLAGSKSGTLYGPGVYLAERSSKADEYAEDDHEGLYQGLFAMLLCRATCGVMNVCEDVKPDVSSLLQSVMHHGTHHSVLGDREKARGTYREFILFDSCQTYPEFIVIYRRYTQTTE